MDKKLRVIGLLLTAVIGVASIIGSNNGNNDRSYIRIDDPSFEGHPIYDIAEVIVDGAPLMVAVGHLGSWTSSDGVTWNFHEGQTLKQVITRGHELFAVTAGKSIVRSSNGQDWNSIFLGSGTMVNHISRTAGGLLAVGMSLNSTSQYWWPAVWLTEDGVTWERHFLGMTSSDVQAYAGAHHGTLLVVGGSYRALGSTTHWPRFWYSEDNGATWASATGPFTTAIGKVKHIVSGDNDVFYASLSTGSLLWKSTDGKNWVVVEDPEVASSGERFSFHDDIIIGQSNVTVVVGSRAGGAATWGYTRTYNTWKSSDASTIFGSEPPTTFTGIGYSPNIAPGYVYTGYRTVGGTLIGAIWLRRPN